MLYLEMYCTFALKVRKIFIWLCLTPAPEKILMSQNIAKRLSMVAINQLLSVEKVVRCPSMVYLAIKGPKTCDKSRIPPFSITFLQLQYNAIDWRWVNNLPSQL